MLDLVPLGILSTVVEFNIFSDCENRFYTSLISFNEIQKFLITFSIMLVSLNPFILLSHHLFFFLIGYATMTSTIVSGDTFSHNYTVPNENPSLIFINPVLDGPNYQM